MNEQNEMDRLMSAWRVDDDRRVPLDLEQLVRSEGWRAGLYSAMEVAVAAAFLGGSLWLAVAQPVAEFVVLAVGIWMVTLGSLIWSWTNRAGTWGAVTADTRGFLEVSMRRCRAGLRAIRYGFWLLGSEVVLLGFWHVWYWSGREAAPGVEVWLWAALVPVVFLVGLVVMQWRWRQKLTRLEVLERELIQAG